MEERPVTRKFFAFALVLGLIGAVPAVAAAASASYHHVHINAPNAEEAAQWYIKNMGCDVAPGRANAAKCGPTFFLFAVKQPTAGSDGSGANHIGFSFPNIEAKIAALQAAGVKVTQPVRDVPNLFKIAYIEDPYGTRIELVEHPEYPGFHHIHLSSPDPDKTLAWYQNILGGERTKMKDRVDALLYGKIFLLCARAMTPVAGTEGRAIDHLGFSFPNLDAAAVEIKGKGITFATEPRPLVPPSTSSVKISFITGPDAVRLEVVEPPK
jgi:lactoylglutathione lyase